MKKRIIFLSGGLGNQMFQYAFYKKEKEEGNNAVCCYGLLLNRQVHNGYELDKVFRNIDSRPLFFSTFLVRILYYSIYIKKNIASKKDIEHVNMGCGIH